jgi:hypothetical protein
MMIDDDADTEQAGGRKEKKPREKEKKMRANEEVAG